MRISDWSSDVCSSDLRGVAAVEIQRRTLEILGTLQVERRQHPVADRKSVVSGKSVSVRVDLGGRRIIKKKRTLDKMIPRRRDIVILHTRQRMRHEKTTISTVNTDRVVKRKRET